MLYLDCEFDGHNGHLISMAIVSDKTQDEFYEVISNEATNPWVIENVLPILGKEPISLEDFRTKLYNYLYLHGYMGIVADSPADFIYFLNMLHEIKHEKYRYINMEIEMHFVISDNYKSDIPHNALSDARALRKWYQNDWHK